MDHRARHDITWASAGSDHFTGDVEFGPMRPPEAPDALAVVGVRFSPGARSDWHHHPAGQVLFVVDGTALVQNDRGDSVSVGPGGIVYAPAGEVHWHGASPEEPLIHLSITDGGPTEWLGRKVSDEEYRSALG